MKGNSFKELRDLQRAQQSGLIQVVTPEQQIHKSIMDAVGELQNLWHSRVEYAKALIAAGAPDSEVIARAEALTIADHKTRTTAALELFSIYGGKVPDGLKFVAHLVGVEVPAQATQKPDSDVKPTNLVTGA